MKHIPVLSTLVAYYRIFRGYAGRGRLFWLFSLILAGGLAEGLGVTLLIPLFGAVGLNVPDNLLVRSIRQSFAWVGLTPTLGPILGLMVLIFLAKGALVFTQAAYQGALQTGVERDLRRAYCARYAAMDYRYYLGANVGFLNNIVTTEIGDAVSSLKNYINLIVSLVYIAISVGLAMAINATLTLAVLGLCVVAAFSLKRLNRLLSTTSYLVSVTNGELQSLLIQFIHNFKYLKATDGFAGILGHINQKIEAKRRYFFKNILLLEATGAGVEPLAVVCLAGLIWYYVGLNHRSLPEILVVLLFFHRAFMRIFETQKVWQNFMASVGSVRIVETAREELDSHREPRGGRAIEGFSGEIRLSGVRFGYGDKTVLRDIDLVIPKNALVGIVGPSGAGKTTLFDIITGLLVPQAGTVTIDGRDYRDLDPASLRRRIGYVTQEPVTFNDTIANNVAFWTCDPGEPACQERIRQAARLAHCLGFIEETEKGFSTVVGDKGVRLSGGQRQRLAIARELYKDPPIMIFDEATSSLDSESENMIRQSIRDMAGTRTLVLIAHRLSTIRDCDRIYVLSHGQVAETGTFDELYADKSSLFHRMCQEQRL